MVGSTTKPLRERTWGYRSTMKWFRDGRYELVTIRVVNHDNPEIFPVYLKAVENCEIARNHTWREEGGRNKIAPLIQWMGSAQFEFERGRLGGIVGGKVAGRKAAESGQIQRAGVLGRKKNMENGQPFRLGRHNVESGHLAKLRTPEHQAKAGRIGGKLGGKTQGPIQGRKNADSGLLAKICANGGRAASHLRWHVNRSVINPNCTLCQPIQ